MIYPVIQPDISLDRLPEDKNTPQNEERNPGKVMLLGMSPMPFENDRKVYGPGIRTWQFVLPLLEKGYELCVCNYAIPSAYSEDLRSFLNRDFKISISKKGFQPSEYRFEYNILKKEDFENPDILAGLFLKFKPGCVAGCSFYPSYAASRMLKTVAAGNGSEQVIKKVPFWADLFGHVMGEAQARAFMDDDDGCLFHYWNSEYGIITSADIFSSVSDRQKYALIGELGAAGRLNRHTSGYEFVHTIPCGMPQEEFAHEKNVIRSTGGITDDDFVVLWTGGYNTWTDVDTLFAGLVTAMEKNPKIKFVSTGGEIPEQDLKTYPGFLKKIESSPYRRNFIMNGWIPGRDVPSYYFEADIGINIDRDIYEVRLGSKSRILDWMRAGLAVLSSNVCELTEIIERKGVGYTFSPGDPADLAAKILYLAANRDEVKKTALRGRKYGLENFSFEKTTESFQSWVKNPVFSPDWLKETRMLLDREEAIKNLELISSKQKKMIDSRDRRISELEAIV
ncbi:MAG: glycosyltransferase family 4 protein, partial [Actinobacteria bacterium]|nr:glycosyltransferase family 4 protein [Actinomycetota bacterium]